MKKLLTAGVALLSVATLVACSSKTASDSSSKDAKASSSKVEKSSTSESKSSNSSKSSANDKTKDSKKDDSKKEDSIADAQKTVLETSDEAGKSIITLYYKGDTLLVQEKVDDYDVSKVAGDNPLQSMKEAVARNQEKFKDLMGHGFELTSEYKDGIFYITNTIDYTKVDIKKLKEIIPTLNLEADNTISYSKAKELFIKSGMVEK